MPMLWMKIFQLTNVLESLLADTAKFLTFQLNLRQL